jgi:hypothetical protein
MKKALRWILVTFALFLCVQCVSASASYAISSVSISPSGALTPGTTVTVSFTLELTGSDETFPNDGTLYMHTDLDDPAWSVTMVKNDDIYEPQAVDNAKNVYLDGWLLSYDPDSYEINLDITLSGTVPSVSSTTEKTIIQVEELDNRNNVVSGSEVDETRTVVNTGEITQLIATRTAALEALNAEIDEKAALGVDTTEAEQNYNAAKSAISTAQSYSSSQYENALASLNNAQTLTTNGETALNKAWAQKEIDDAAIPLANADAEIAWLKPNATSSDAKSSLSEITTKREIAAGYISTANDEVYSGNYDYARQKAEEAFTKANETYTDALALRKQLGTGWFPSIKLPGGSALIIGIVIIVVVVAVGYVIYRKRTQWDELG